MLNLQESPFRLMPRTMKKGRPRNNKIKVGRWGGNGLLPIAHYGCGQYAPLILNVQFQGEIWIAYWAVDEGIQKFGNYAQEHDPRLETEDVGYDFKRWYDS